MPKHAAHEMFNLILSPLCLLCGLALGFNLIFMIAGYVFATFYLSPDLDVKCKAYYRWGPIRFYWLPYRWAMKHRGTSHNYVLGPISLILYAVIPILPLLIIIDFIHLLPAITGAVLAIELHIILDKVT